MQKSDKQVIKKKNEPKIYQEYALYQNKYGEIYGMNETVILLMCGGFYELYATDGDSLDLKKITELLNIVFTRKNKSEPVSINNPYMAGFPLVALNKFVRVLVANNYTVVIVDQVETVNVGKKKNRMVTNIFSPGTYIDDSIHTPDSNDIVLLYIQDEIQLNGNILISVGMSSIDLSTGKCTTYESHATLQDDKYGLDESIRFINTFNAKEIIIYRVESSIHKKGFFNKEKLMSYLELENKKVLYYTKIDKQFNKISYQNELLAKIYKNHGMLTPIEYLELDKYPYATLAFILILDFAYKHNENIINNMIKPFIYHNNKKLILGNNAAEQLNIISNGINTNAKFKSLFDLVNNTSTLVGRRFLKSALQIPLTDPIKIKQRYDLIEELVNTNYIIIEQYLKQIIDIERIHRKIAINNIHPYELYNLFNSYNAITEIIFVINKSDIMRKILPPQQILDDVYRFVQYIKKTFDIQSIEISNLNDLGHSLFPEGYTVIDNLHKNIQQNEQLLEQICNILSSYINNSLPKNKIDNCHVQYEFNEHIGHHLKLSLQKNKILKTQLKTLQVIHITDDLTISCDKMEFTEQKSGAKIISPEIRNISYNIKKSKEKLCSLVLIEYKKIINQMYNEFNNMFMKINKFIGLLDFIKSAAKTAILNNYVKPELIISDYGFIDCHQLRHPLVEKINNNVEYVPHDIQLGKSDTNNISGIILYGLNSAGKSTLSKSIAISIIMAQCGMFVAATKYRYSPYELLFARITGNDNILKGLSSYSVEMIETRAILNRSNNKSLIIGDEVCRGTEYISGNSIVAATLIHLSNTGSSFIFASHLHEIPKLERIKKLTNIKCYHLTVEIDDNDNLIFDRKLKDGQGNTMYGITVARHIIHNNDFIKLAQELKCELLNQHNKILNNKPSKYNPHVFVDSCALCPTKLSLDKFGGFIDVHHINEQKNCKNGFVIDKPYIKKNSKANLVSLCKSCHQKEHNNELTILGYKQTSNGRKLNVVKKNEKVII
jgi:DNA mismatch repair protein MutS